MLKGVHNWVPADVLEVPQYILLHLAKGGKFVPFLRGSSHPAANSELNGLHRRLLLCKCFPDDNRSMTRCRLRSSWQPPADSNVDIFMRLLKREFASYEFQTARANWSWLDRKALACLAQHRDSIAAVDCDKGLGDALVPGHGFVNKFIANFLRGLYRHRITIFRPGWTAANNMQMHWCSFVVRQARFPMMALVGFYSAHYMKNAQVPSELLSKSTRSQLDLYAICEVFGWLRLQLFWWNN